jgi:DNA polymerase
MELHLDLETYCSENLKTAGIYKYVNSPDFEVLLLSYKLNNKPTRCIDLASGEKIPSRLIQWIKDPKVKKKGWNVIVEFLGLQKLLQCVLDFKSWFCTMAKSAYNGFPLALDSASKVLIPGMGKLDIGKALVKYFCVPCKPTKANGYRFRNMPNDAPEKWQDFKRYNIRDVDAETLIDHKLPCEMPLREESLFRMDQLINAMGVKIDKAFIHAAIKIDADNRKQLLKKAADITGLENPNSTSQLLAWLQNTSGQEIENLKAETVDGLLKHYKAGEIHDVLTIRKELALSSVKKYKRMLMMVNRDGYIKGLLQFYGANRTGRWAGRGVQIHNLATQGDLKLKALELMRDVVASDFSLEQVLMIYGNATQLLKILIRTAFVPPKGKQFVVADFSAIEARVIAWLANEKWRLDIFKTHGKIYEASASRMFKVAIELITKESELRKKGKVSELALGYQGSVGALIQMGALKMGLMEEELLPMVRLWRKENPNIVKLWYTAENAFKAALQMPGKRITFCRGLLSVVFRGKYLAFRLPSGRELFYPSATITNAGNITYMGMDQKTNKWVRLQLYGGKIVENAVQAIARDLLAESLFKLTRRGYEIPMHVHDELIVQVAFKHVQRCVADVQKVMNTTPVWAAGLPLKCDIFTAVFYRKN